MVEAALAEGILAKAMQRDVLTVRARDLREFTGDRHRTVDDVPYGGGPGMVLKPEPVFKAVDAIIDALTTHLSRLAKNGEQIPLPDDIGLVAKIFPVLARVPGVTDASSHDELDPIRVQIVANVEYIA